MVIKWEMTIYGNANSTKIHSTKFSAKIQMPNLIWQPIFIGETEIKNLIFLIKYNFVLFVCLSLHGID